MKLICLSNSCRQKVYDVFPPGISLGREEDNDVVIMDNEASRYHAKIEHFDNLWYVHDINSSNGVYLNGTKIEGSAPLSVMDEIKVGTMLFRFGDDTMVDENSAAPVTEGTATPGTVKSGGASKLTVILAVVLIILIGLVAFAILRPPASAVVAAPPPVDDSLQVMYEKLEATRQQVFRYELQIKDKHLHIMVDDLSNGTHIDEERNLSDDQVDMLKSALLTDELRRAEAPKPDRRRNQLERSRLLVRVGPDGNYLVVENAVPPAAFSDAQEVLTQYVQRELGVFSYSIPRKEVVKLARDQFELAENYLSDISIDPGNLYKAILSYRQVIERLKYLEGRPEFYDLAVMKLRKAEDALDTQVDKLEREAVVFRNIDRFSDAIKCHQEIIRRIPDPNDPRVKRANSEIVRLEDARIKKKKGN